MNIHICFFHLEMMIKDHFCHGFGSYLQRRLKGKSAVNPAASGLMPVTDPSWQER
jgi:hypothetical protein